MKKHITMILLIFVILSSCTAPTEQSQETTSDTTAAVVTNPVVVPQSKEIKMKNTKGVIIASKPPYMRDAYKKSGESPADIGYILSMEDLDLIMDEDLFSYKTNITYNISHTSYWTQYNFGEGAKYYYDIKTNYSGIIDNRENFISYCASLGVTEEMLSKHFQETHFDDNIVIITLSSYEEMFLGFDYGFDPLSKTLKIEFTTRPHEGWQERPQQVAGYTAYIVSIAKADITADGEPIPYEELNIKYSGKIID